MTEVVEIKFHSREPETAELASHSAKLAQPQAATDTSIARLNFDL